MKYQALYDYTANVTALLLLNIASFPTPLPSLATTNGLNATLLADIAAWGAVGARGSHAQLLSLRQSAQAVYNALVQLANYVQNTVDPTTTYAAQAAFIALSGFGVKNPPVPQGPLAAVQALHQLIQPRVSQYSPKLKWKRPIGVTSPGNVKAYQIYRGATAVFGASQLIATSTKTSFVDQSAAPGASYYYFVLGINTAGKGAPSAGLPISVPN
ncbi:MAG: hypothetical protein ACHQF4_11335 [Sphingobacteriales bacterium]